MNNNLNYNWFEMLCFSNQKVRLDSYLTKFRKYFYFCREWMSKGGVGEENEKEFFDVRARNFRFDSYLY